jgi:hypothetical protein
MKIIIPIFFILFSIFNSNAQLTWKGRAKGFPIDLGKDTSEIVVFQLLNTDDAIKWKISSRRAEEYNKAIREHSEMYKGKKELLFTDEIEGLDFSNEKYRYFFALLTVKGECEECPMSPSSMGLVDMSDGLAHMSTMIYFSPAKKEIKKEIKALEKARVKN